MSNITAKTIRNLNQNDFVGFNSDRRFVQKSWLFTDSERRTTAVCSHMCPSVEM